MYSIALLTSRLNSPRFCRSRTRPRENSYWPVTRHNERSRMQPASRQQTTYGNTRRADLAWATDIYPAYYIQCRPLPPTTRYHTRFTVFSFTDFKENRLLWHVINLNILLINNSLRDSFLLKIMRTMQYMSWLIYSSTLLVGISVLNRSLGVRSLRLKI